MGEQKKSAKAGRGANSNSAKNYIASGKRYVNKLRDVKRHCRRNPDDKKAAAWLKFMSGIFSIDYKRGAPFIKSAQEGIYGRS